MQPSSPSTFMYFEMLIDVPKSFSVDNPTALFIDPWSNLGLLGVEGLEPSPSAQFSYSRNSSNSSSRLERFLISFNWLLFLDFFLNLVCSTGASVVFSGGFWFCAVNNFYILTSYRIIFPAYIKACDFVTK